MDQDEILLDCEDRMDKAFAVFQGQLQGLRTGRATPSDRTVLLDRTDHVMAAGRIESALPANQWTERPLVHSHQSNQTPRYGPTR